MTTGVHHLKNDIFLDFLTKQQSNMWYTMYYAISNRQYHLDEIFRMTVGKGECGNMIIKQVK